MKAKPIENSKEIDALIDTTILQQRAEALESANKILSEQVKELTIRAQVLQDAYADSEQMCMNMRAIAVQRGMEIQHLKDALANPAA